MEKKLITALVAICTVFIFINTSDDFYKLQSARKYTMNQEYKKAYKILRPLAERGNVVAQYNLGVMNEKGDGTPLNYEKAVKWYHLAANQGDPKAQNNLGNLYRMGEGVLQNYQEARKWYQRSANQGHLTAQLNLEFLTSDQL